MFAGSLVKIIHFCVKLDIFQGKLNSFQKTVDIVLGKLEAFAIKMNIFETKTSFLYKKI